MAKLTEEQTSAVFTDTLAHGATMKPLAWHIDGTLPRKIERDEATRFSVDLIETTLLKAQHAFYVWVLDLPQDAAHVMTHYDKQTRWFCAYAYRNVL